MQDDMSGGDPKNLWQNQPREPFGMTVEEIRQLAADLHTKTRRKLLGTLAGPLAAAFFYAFSFKALRTVRPEVQALFIFGVVWGMVGLYFLNRGMWSAALAENATAVTGLEFCRREIEHRRDLLRRMLLWSFAPVMFAIGCFVLALAGVVGRGIFPNGLPFMILVIVWVVAYFVVRLREQQQLQRELDELNQVQGRQTSM